MMAHVLVVEDDYDLREALSDTFASNNLSCMAVEDGNTALAMLNKKSDQIGVVLSDVQMPNMDGIELVEKIRIEYPFVPVLLMTAYGSIDSAVESIKKGAVDFIAKPFEADDLVKKVKSYLKEDNDKIDFDGFKYNYISKSPLFKKILELARKIATSNSTILLQGESGTGKEVVSYFIHKNSKKSKNPFVAVNCAAIPENMLEAIMFGYEKGSYTGAYQGSSGKFEQANNGTILLDEITEMPLSLQAKLLRVLQEKEVERIGGKKAIPLDVRVIATTNRDLKQEVRVGNFREDLFYRLNVFPVKLPALRERKEDILPMAKFFLHKFCQEFGKPNVIFSDDAEQAMLRYQWPGNIRELENAVQRSLLLCGLDVIYANDLMFDIQELSDVEFHQESIESVKCMQDEIVLENQEKLLGESLKQKENNIIIQTLKSTQGSRKEAAKMLGISTRTLRYKLARMRELGFDINQLIQS